MLRAQLCCVEPHRPLFSKEAPSCTQHNSLARSCIVLTVTTSLNKEVHHAEFSYKHGVIIAFRFTRAVSPLRLDHSECFREDAKVRLVYIDYLFNYLGSPETTSGLFSKIDPAMLSAFFVAYAMQHGPGSRQGM